MNAIARMEFEATLSGPQQATLKHYGSCDLGYIEKGHKAASIAYEPGDESPFIVIRRKIEDGWARHITDERYATPEAAHKAARRYVGLTENEEA